MSGGEGARPGWSMNKQMPSAVCGEPSTPSRVVAPESPLGALGGIGARSQTVPQTPTFCRRWKASPPTPSAEGDAASPPTGHPPRGRCSPKSVVRKKAHSEFPYRRERSRLIQSVSIKMR